jgi:anti-anti-sigma factor
MKIERTEAPDGITILTFTGEFDAVNLPKVSEEIDQHIENGHRRLIFNLGGLSFLNSSALGYLIRTHKTLREYGGELVIAAPSAFFRTTIATLGIHEIFRICPDDASAVEHLQGGVGETASEYEGVPAEELLPGSTEFAFRLLEDPGAPAVGEMLELFEDGLTFQYPSNPDRVRIDPDELEIGRQLRARFRVPFLEQEDHLECEVEIVGAADVEGDPHGAAEYRVRYTRVDPGERAALAELLGRGDA